jgi:hypothetical protein
MAILACVHALYRQSHDHIPELGHTYNITGPSFGTFSEPMTSISRKKDVIAELASATNGLWVKPNGILLGVHYYLVYRGREAGSGVNGMTTS